MENPEFVAFGKICQRCSTQGVIGNIWNILLKYWFFPAKDGDELFTTEYRQNCLNLLVICHFGNFNKIFPNNSGYPLSPKFAHLLGKSFSEATFAAPFRPLRLWHRTPKRHFPKENEECVHHPSYPNISELLHFNINEHATRGLFTIFTNCRKCKFYLFYFCLSSTNIPMHINPSNQFTHGEKFPNIVIETPTQFIPTIILFA